MKQQPIMRVVCEGQAPKYANEKAAGLDLRYCGTETVRISPGERVSLKTGLRVEIPSGYFGLVAIRSGLGFRGLILTNGIGVIDEDYRGEIGLSVNHMGEEPIVIEPGERVAQLILVPYVQGRLEFVQELSETDRGSGGFGSSGRF